MEKQMTEQDKELLESIYQTAGLGRDILGKLIKTCEDSNFRFAMATEFAEYQAIIDDAKAFAEKNGQNLEPQKRKTKNTVYGALKLNLMIDKTSSHLAEMLVQGSTMGVIEMKRKLKENADANEELTALGERLVKTEQNNIHSMLNHV